MIYRDHFCRFLFCFAILAVVCIASLFGPKVGDAKHVVDPSSFFAFINFIYVRAGFLISLAAVGLLTTLNMKRADKDYSFREKLAECSIGIAATTYWALCRIIFFWLDKQSGSCRQIINQSVNQVFRNRTACSDAGGYWDGFDPSGHCFLASLASIFFYDQLYLAGNINLKQREHLQRRPSTPHLVQRTMHISSNTDTILRVIHYAIMLVAVMILILWLTLMLHTSLYFHTIAEKFVGVLVGFAFWPVVFIIRKAV